MAKLMLELLQRWSSRKGPWLVSGKVEEATDLPESIPAERALLVGTVVHPKWIAFECPCGRGHRIMLNLDKTRRPFWRVTSEEPLSIRPSVDAVYRKRRCHYVVSNGRVIWVHERRYRKESNDGR
jgi:hypothetical protein